MKKLIVLFVLLFSLVGGFCVGTCALSACTFQVIVEVPDGALVIPPIQVPCVENRDAGWVCKEQ